ncbi:hypothetical protein D3C86_1695830 [compost metagenome]
MLKKVLDLVERVLRHIGQALHEGGGRAQLVHGHGHQLGVHAGLVGHLQHAERTAAHHGAGQDRERRQHQHVHRVTVAGQRLRNEAVVGRVAHARADETVDEQQAGFLVGLVLHRIALGRNLDDDVEIVGKVLARGDEVEAHASSPNASVVGWRAL